MWNDVIPAVLGSLFAIGASILWTRHLLFGPHASRDQSTLRSIMGIIGWLSIFLGVLGASILMFHLLSLVILLALLVVILMSLQRHWVSERESLLWMLGICAERDIPLSEVARAFSMERKNIIGDRAQVLSLLLARGMPAPAALRQSSCVRSLDAELALQLGAELDVMGPSIREISAGSQETSSLMRSAIDKIIYLNLIVLAIGVAKIFLVLRIVPVMNRMFQEFDLEVPPITQLIMENSLDGAIFLIIGGPILLVSFIAAVLSVMHYSGLIPRDTPGVGLLCRRYDGARVMRSLGVAVRNDRSLGDALRLLARRFPRNAVRFRLINAGTLCNSGMHWCDALLRVQLIGAAEAAVLKAAERNGNLGWALGEMADSTVRRILQRFRASFSIVFTLALLTIGGMVMALVLAMFSPLVSLISGLS